MIEGQEILATASIGIAHPASRRERPEELLRNADVAMYCAKGRGRGKFETYERQMQATLLRRLEIVAEIRQGLASGEFAVHFQPVIRLWDGAITGYEALARWNHPRLGLVMPADFIPVAEETGQILEIGAHVLRVACRQARLWRDAVPGGLSPSMSVNVSARQFRAESLCATVAEALALADLRPESLVLEITESVIMDDSGASLARLRDLKALGVRLAIDDFGTGYSSLSYLRRLPVDILKIDKSFIDEVRDDGTGAPELTRVIVEMGNTLNLDVVAEGVETAAQAGALRRIGCGFAQGYHFGRPMAANDIAQVVIVGAHSAARSAARLPTAPSTARTATRKLAAARHGARQPVRRSGEGQSQVPRRG